MLRVAIIGFGFMGMTHAANIQRNKRLARQAIITRHRCPPSPPFKPSNFALPTFLN